jgi:hypothetical protein
VRTLFVSQEILEAFASPLPADRATSLADFRQNLDAFLEGGELSVAEDPFEKDAYAMLARVSPVDNEFWDFRVTTPKPQIRAFGGFAEKDTFVLVTWEYRDVIDDEFDAAVERCRVEWQKLFGRVTPFKGNSLDAYLSNYIPV